MKYLLLLLCFASISFKSDASNQKDPSHWTIQAVPLEKNTYRIEFKVHLDPSWHIWTLNPGGDSRIIAPSFKFNPGNFKLIERIGEQGMAVEGVLGGFKSPAYFYQSDAIFTQIVEAKKGIVITGSYTYQICGNKNSLPSVTKPFKVKMP